MVDGRVMVGFSVVVLALQLAAVGVLTTAEDGGDPVLRGAIKALEWALTVSIVGRAVSSAAWSMSTLYERRWGLVVLLLLSAVSSITTLVLLGSVSPPFSVLSGTAKTKAAPIVMGSAGAVILELLYSHKKYLYKDVVVDRSANVFLARILKMLLVVVVIGSLVANAFLVQKSRHHNTLYQIAIGSLVLNGALFLGYLMKAVIRLGSHNSRALCMSKIVLSTGVLVTAAVSYGATLPKLTSLGVSGNERTLLKWDAVNFYLVAGTVVVAHLLAFSHEKHTQPKTQPGEVMIVGLKLSL